MYKTFTLLIVLFFTNTTINAQSKEEFDKSVDYCACKIAYAYTQDFAKKNPNKDERKSFNEVIKEKIENCDKNTLSVADLSKLLKENNFKGFSNTLIPEAQDAKEKFTDNLTKTEAIEIIIGSFISSFEKMNIKDGLKKDLKNKLDSFNDNQKTENKTIVASKTISNDEINPSGNLINSKKEVKSNSFIPNWLLLVLVLLSILLFLYNYLSNKGLKDSIKRHRDEIEKLKIAKSPFNQSNHQNNNNSQFEQTINRNISDINDAIRKLQKENSNNQISQQNRTSQTTTHTRKNSQKEIQNFLYAKTPIDEKTFNASDVSEEKDGKFYKFTIGNDKNKAEFEFFNTENSAKRAVNSPDVFLYPVCEEIESLNQNAKKIITNKKGVVIKQDDKWIVKEKAQISYE